MHDKDGDEEEENESLEEKRGGRDIIIQPEEVEEEEDNASTRKKIWNVEYLPRYVGKNGKEENSFLSCKPEVNSHKKEKQVPWKTLFSLLSEGRSTTFPEGFL